MLQIGIPKQCEWVECANGSSERAPRSYGSSGSRNVNIIHISFPMHRYGELKLTHLLRVSTAV